MVKWQGSTPRSPPNRQVLDAADASSSTRPCSGEALLRPAAAPSPPPSPRRPPPPLLRLNDAPPLLHLPPLLQPARAIAARHALLCHRRPALLPPLLRPPPLLRLPPLFSGPCAPSPPLLRRPPRPAPAAARVALRKVSFFLFFQYCSFD